MKSSSPPPMKAVAPDGQEASPPEAQAGEAVKLVIRPEAWRIAPASGAGLLGKVLRCTYLGRSAQYLVQVPWGEVWVSALNAFTSDNAMLKVGSPISLSLGRLGVSALASSPTPQAPQAPPTGQAPAAAKLIQSEFFFQNAQPKKMGQLQETLQ